MSTQSFNSSLLDLLPDTIIELYEIDLGEQDGIFRFHPGTISSSNIVFDGRTYISIPVDAAGFEKKGDGKMPRPTLTVANLEGLMSDAIKTRSDLVGHMFTRKRTFLKYLDSVNFPNSFNPFAIPDPEARFSDDRFLINKKSQENKFFVEFELISPLEYEGAKLPARIMVANYCPWVYRGEGCLYGQDAKFEQTVNDIKDTNIFTDGGLVIGNLGVPVADEDNKIFWDKDGYGIDLPDNAYKGDYDKTTTYNRGHIVRIKSYFNVSSKIGQSGEQENDDCLRNHFYVCIKDSTTGKDPQFEKENWVADKCSKNLTGCKIRFKHYSTNYKKGLPFGGFPSIESYRF